MRGAVTDPRATCAALSLTLGPCMTTFATAHPRWFATLLALSLVGCGGASAEAHAPTSSAAATSEAEALVGPPAPWPELSTDARRAHMAAHVSPAMGALFREWDATRFDDFGCATCHGTDARERSFAMPNHALPALYPSGSIGQRQTVDRFPDGARFMFNRVMPAMQTLLGAAPYDTATGEGFTCFACHPHAADSDPLAQVP